MRMMFKNSLRLLSSNFDKVWKLLVYKLISLGVVIALLAPFFNELLDCATIAYKEFDLESFFATGTFYGINVASALTSICRGVLMFFSLIFTRNLGMGIYFVIIVFLVRPILGNIGKYVMSEMVYSYMATSSKHSFTGTLLRTLNKSLLYALLRTLYNIFFDGLVLISLFGLTRITNTNYGYVMPILIVIVPSLLLAFRETFNAGWAPAMVVFDNNAVKAYPKGMRASLRRGARVYSTAFIIYLLAFVLSMVLGLYSLIIILPVIFPLIDVFGMVMFFSSQGMRFYVDADTILTPKKLEEVDKIDDAKYLL